jgi:hypothetical protein
LPAMRLTMQEMGLHDDGSTGHPNGRQRRNI